MDFTIIAEGCVQKYVTRPVTNHIITFIIQTLSKIIKVHSVIGWLSVQFVQLPLRQSFSDLTYLQDTITIAVKD